MSLNVSKGNMYDFVNFTWNTIKGKCPHDCSYCYMKKWGNLKDIRFDEKELKTDLGKGNFIFVGSSCDMFEENIIPAWVIKTLNHCKEFDNKYLFQTKNPKAYSDYVINIASLNNFILGTTIETNRWYPGVMGNCPSSVNRAEYMNRISITEKFVTIEPIMDFDLKEMIKLIKMCEPMQINIGADSGRNNLPEPSKEKILELINELSKFTKVKQKNNLKRLL